MKRTIGLVSGMVLLGLAAAGLSACSTGGYSDNNRYQPSVPTSGGKVKDNSVRPIPAEDEWYKDPS